MVHELVAACGIRCVECPARIATQARDVDAARRVAREWSAAYHVEVDVSDVWCDGCMVPGRKCAHCAECEVRTCAIARNVEHCGACAKYPCAPLKAFHAMVPAARDVLERLRAGATASPVSDPAG